MAFTLVQSAEGTSAVSSPSGLAFASAPTSGNLIVLAWQGGAYANIADSGWFQVCETQNNHGQYLWWRLSDGGNSFGYSMNGTSNSSWVLAEFSGGPDQIDVAAMQRDVNIGTSYTTPSITPSTGERLLIAVLGGDQNGDASGDQTTWLNSFTHIRTSGPTSGTSVANLGLGYRVVTGDDSTAYSSGSTFPVAVTMRNAAIAAFKAVGNLTGASTPAFRALASLSYASRTNATVSAPSGLADNDIMIAQVFAGIAASSGSPTVTGPSGFKLLYPTPQEVNDGGFCGRLWLFWKRAASESGSYTFTHATATSQVCLAAFSGCVTTGTPIDGYSYNFSGGTADACAFSPNSTNDLVIFADHGWTGSATTPPSGMTEQFDTTLLTMSTITLSSRGDTGSTSHSSSNPRETYYFALRGPASGGATSLAPANPMAFVPFLVR